MPPSCIRVPVFFFVLFTLQAIVLVATLTTCPSNQPRKIIVVRPIVLCPKPYVKTNNVMRVVICTLRQVQKFKVVLEEFIEGGIAARAL